MGARENKELIRRFVTELNKGKAADLDSVVDDGYTLIIAKPLCRSLAELKKMIAAWPPDRRFTIEDIIAEGDTVVYTWISTGTRDGKVAKSSGITVSRIAGDRIVEDRDWSRDITEP